jgi:hypothetical protein
MELKEKNKCYKCNKNVHLYGLQCKCKKIYCYICLDINNHKCDFDYKAENIINLTKNNKQIKKEKVIKI